VFPVELFTDLQAFQNSLKLQVARSLRSHPAPKKYSQDTESMNISFLFLKSYTQLHLIALSCRSHFP